MATKPLKSITFPNLPDIYTVPQIDSTLLEQGQAADSKAVGDAIDTLDSSLSQRLETAENNVNMITQQIPTFADGLEVDEEGLVYLLNNGERIAGPYGPFAGGGGGGGGGTQTTMAITNDSGWLMKTVSKDTSLSVQCTWSSTLDDIPTGAGVLTIYVGGALRQTRNINQGTFTVSLDPYLTTAGSKLIRIKVTDAYGASREVRYTVAVEDFTITSSFDAHTPVTDAFAFYYTPKGTGTKTVHFKVDGTELSTETVEVSGRQQQKTIPAPQNHGSHTLEVWFEITVDEESIESNHLWYNFMFVDGQSNTPIITSQYNGDTVEQYGTIVIPYQVYDPADITTQVVLAVDGTTVQTITVDRTEQQWSYRPIDYGEKTFTITCGNVVKTFIITVTQSEAEIGAVTEDLSLYLTAQGRSNQEEHPEIWEYTNGANTISATLTGFNYVNDGWILDNDGVTVLRVSGDARVTIPYKIFAQDFRSTGKTIEFEFATRNVMNYDTPILSCFNDGRGFVATSQKVSISSEQSSLETQYKEDEHVRISFVIEKRSEQHRLMYCYINGVLSAVTQYPDNDDFSQVTPVNISIGTNDSSIDIYNIRIYDNNLTRHQILDNWIADTADVATMMARYDHNNIFDNNNNVVIEKLPSDLPYMIITSSELPQAKGDKMTCAITYVDPIHPAKSFTNSNVQIDVQGTSSQYYPRKNYKIKGKGKYVNSNGQESSTYQLTDDCLPANVFCLKADFASSEGANNVELVRAYCQACPYETPAQEEEPLVRQGIDGFPIVIFWNDGTDTQFIGKYNFNLDKGAENCFGFVQGDESWEIKTHASNRVLWKVSDFEGDGWLDDFEARYPDIDPPFEDPTQLKAFSDWICQTDTEAATNNSLAQSVTYDGVTYTTDSAAYRLAKFKAEIGDYVEIDSMLFYYLFTELFLMVDSRSKNMFPSFIGEEVN